jgi:hypothetical protein
MSDKNDEDSSKENEPDLDVQAPELSVGLENDSVR